MTRGSHNLVYDRGDAVSLKVERRCFINGTVVQTSRGNVGEKSRDVDHSVELRALLGEAPFLLSFAPVISWRTSSFLSVKFISPNAQTLCSFSANIRRARLSKLLGRTVANHRGAPAASTNGTVESCEMQSVSAEALTTFCYATSGSSPHTWSRYSTTLEWP